MFYVMKCVIIYKRHREHNFFIINSLYIIKFTLNSSHWILYPLELVNAGSFMLLYFLKNAVEVLILSLFLIYVPWDCFQKASFQTRLIINSSVLYKKDCYSFYCILISISIRGGFFLFLIKSMTKVFFLVLF